TPMWVVMPHHTHEFKAPVELRADLKKNGIRAVAILSDVAHFGFSLAEWNSGVLLSMLEECRIPVFVSMSCFDASFRELHDLLKAHPQLPVVLTEISYRVSRNIFPLMRLFPNLHLESYGYKAQDGIEELCREFGADRVVFGSGMPDASGAAAVAMITYANITDEEKALIASGNLDRLMGGVRI
ncbi:MAG: amidohydrolase family protein, partial [Clostridia bacterium]